MTSLIALALGAIMRAWLGFRASVAQKLGRAEQKAEDQTSALQAQDAILREAAKPALTQSDIERTLDHGRF